MLLFFAALDDNKVRARKLNAQYGSFELKATCEGDKAQVI